MMEIWWFLILLTLFTQCNSQLLSADGACKHLPCYWRKSWAFGAKSYKGKATMLDGNCFCECVDGYTGLLCEYEIETSKWPRGPYATPMTIYGCPEEKGSISASGTLKSMGWKTGYMNMTFIRNLTEYASHFKKSVIHPGNISLLGPYDDYAIQMNFCYKTNSHVFNPDPDKHWPRGSYQIYRAGGTCPEGFNGTVFKTELPAVLNHAMDGYIPDIELDAGSHSTSLVFHVCEKQQSFTEEIEPRDDSAFILLKDISKDMGQKCPEYPGLDIKEEELSVISLMYCAYTPSSEEQLLNTIPPETFIRDKEWESFYAGFTVTFHDVSQEDRLQAETNTISPALSIHTNNMDDTPWFLMDLLYTRIRSNIFIKLNLDFKASQLTQRDFPVSSCSLKKWSFLRNGGIRGLGCRWLVTQTESNYNYMVLVCNQRCRYQAVVAENYWQSKLSTYFSHIQGIKIEVLSPDASLRSGANVGMTDDRVDDSQISASSHMPNHPPHNARPHLQGWCAKADDVEPYLQFDLVGATEVSGVRMYNWFSSSSYFVNNIFSAKLHREGIEWFTIKYGLNTETLVDYTKSDGSREFWLDKSLPYSEEQEFIFPESVIASVIQVYPKNPSPGDKCMRIEVIGHSQTVMKGLSCEGNEHRFWTAVPEVFVSTDSPYYSLEHSLVDCKAKCSANSKCVAVMFNSNSANCSQFSLPSGFKYIERKAEAHSSLYQLFCAKDYPAEATDYSFESSQGLSLSAGYPIGPLGFKYVLRLKFLADNAKFMQMMFTNLSVDVRKIPSEQGVTCEDKIQITDNYFVPTVHETLLPGSGQLVFPWEWTEASIHINPCIGTTGTSVLNFRIISTLSDIILCKSTKTPKESLCNGREKLTSRGLLASNSFLGLSYRRMSHEFWNIRGQYQHILIKIIEMFIRCNSGSVLEVKYTNSKLQQFCNGRRQIDRSVSINSEVVIYFRSNPDSTTSEGFVAEYQKRRFSPHITDNMATKQDMLRMDPSSANYSRPVEMQYQITYSTEWLRIGGEGLFSLSVAGVMCHHLGFSGEGVKASWKRIPARSEQLVMFENLRCTGKELNLFDCENTLMYSDQPDYSYIFTVKCRPLPPDVCRRNKCYHFFRNEPTNSSQGMSAAEANVHCAMTYGKSSSLVHISDEEEAMFIKPHIVFWLINVSNILPDVSHMGYAYIGLFRSLKDGKVEEQWANGSPVSYSEWTKGHPGEGLSKGGCTRLEITSFADVNSWEAIPCDKHKAEYFVCETRYGIEYDGNLHDQLVARSNDTQELTYRNFKCMSGEFISVLFLCDGLKDCLDGTDEHNCSLSKLNGECHEEYFQCGDGECVPISACCDYIPNCNDASDEYCEFPSCNNATEYQCDNSQCIDIKLRCNTVPDCLDGSDEDNCDTCPENMLMCWDRKTKCVPQEKICDGFIDCYDERDERNCDLSCQSSCRDWWLKGYRQSGEFCIDGNRAECNFDSEGIMKTIYHDIEGQLAATSNQESLDISYGSLGFVQKLVNDLNCKQSIKNQCRPPTSMIAKAEGIANNTGYWHCLCVHWTFFEDDSSTIETCSDETTKEVDKRGKKWFEDIAVKIKIRHGFPITNIQFDTSPQPFETLTFESLVCEEAFNKTEFDSIVCKRGNLVSSENRCLYQMHPNGDVKGCADMTHLQNCEEFQCPNGFVKCPRGYCIPLHFLCDGKSQCPDGNDEINCWCGKTSPVITMIFPANNERIHKSMITTAMHLHQLGENGSNVRLLQYLQSTTRENKTKEESSLDHKRVGVAEIRYYDYRKYDQLKELYFSGSMTDAFQMLLQENSTLYDKNDIRLVFVDQQTLFAGAFSEWFMVNSSLKNLYVIFVGDIGGDLILDDIVTQNFPKETHYIHIKDPKYTATFALERFAFVCPVPEAPVCEGLYRCHASRMCLDLSSLCDGVAHCPHQDDERLCFFECPDECECIGYSVNCSDNRATKETLTSLSKTTRSLDLNRNNLQDALDTAVLPFMVALKMARCRLRRVPRDFIQGMRNLMDLDLSFNEMDVIHEGDFSNKHKLLSINLEGNTRLRIIHKRAFQGLINIQTLVIRNTKVKTIEPWTFAEMNLELLDLSNNELMDIKTHAFSHLQVKAINISYNKISAFPRNMLKDIIRLKLIVSDAYKFCCIKPKDVTDENCKPQPDEFSSCEDLMRNEPLRFLLWLVGLSALVGNILSIIYRLKFDRKKLKLGYGIFVTNLAISDFLMGLYLFIIATADIAFRGEYIFADEWWRNSHWCKLAGVLATMSSEASVLFMCFITLDRLIVIKYPFATIRFKTKSALAVIVCVWIIVAIIACIPLVWTSYFQNRFYSQSGVCLALPLTRKHTEEAGSAYSITIFIGFNFFTFLLIGIGQFLLYQEMKMASKRGEESGQNRKGDLKVARNLLLVVMTDFLCWFPIGVMGLLSLGGVTIPGVVYSWAAVIILPVNSALNPFLYTVPAILGKKKFKPDVEEQQTKRVEVTIDETAKMIEVWNKSWILQKSAAGHKSVPLTRYVSKCHLGRRDVLTISHYLIDMIFKIHEYTLVTDGLSRYDVYIRTRKKKVSVVLAKLSPRFMISKIQRREDMKDVGKIILWLLKNVDGQKR